MDELRLTQLIERHHGPEDSCPGAEATGWCDAHFLLAELRNVSALAANLGRLDRERSVELMRVKRDLTAAQAALAGEDETTRKDTPTTSAGFVRCGEGIPCTVADDLRARVRELEQDERMEKLT